MIPVDYYMQNERKRMECILKEYPGDMDPLLIRNMCVCFCKYCGEYVLLLRRHPLFPLI